MCLPCLVCSPQMNPLMFGVNAIYKYFSLLALAITFFLLGFLFIGGASTESAYLSIYLIRMRYNGTSVEVGAIGKNTTGVVSGLTIRANYLTLCASAAGDMVCTTSRNITGLDNTISNSHSTGVSNVSLVAISSALTLVCKPYLLITTLVLVLSMTVVLLWLMMPFVPGKVLARKLCAGTALFTSLVWGIGAMLQHQAIVSAEAFVEAATQKYIQVERGSKAEALSWTAFLFLILAFFALLFRLWREQRQMMSMSEKC